MGHLRLGRLYRSRRWTEVIETLDSPDLDVPRMAALTITAADKEMARLGQDPAVSYGFWILVKLIWSARSDSFSDELRSLGIEPGSVSSAFALISHLTDVVRAGTRHATAASIFVDIASLSLRQTLGDTIVDGSNTLFGTSLRDVQNACRMYSSQRQFGRLSRRYFAHFVSRCLTYFLNKELSNHVGADHPIGNSFEAAEFNSALAQYAHQSARIVEDFAGGWYSKWNWQTGGDIRQEDCQRFFAYALRKLRMELKGEGAILQ